MLDYERLMADPATAPYQYLHAGSTDHENYRFEDVPVSDANNHAIDDDALDRMLPRYLEPALDFFDAFLAGRTDPASVPRVALASRKRRLARVAVVAAARRARGAPPPLGRRRPRGRAGRTPARWPGCTTRRTSSRRRSSIPSRSCSSTRTRARSRPGRTSPSSPASPSPRRSRSRAASLPTCGSEATARRCAST